MIGFAFSENGRRKTGMIHRVRIILRFKTEAREARIQNTAFAVRRGILVDEVACIQLHARLGGRSSQDDAGTLALYQSELS